MVPGVSDAESDSPACRVPDEATNPIVEDTPGSYSFTVPEGVIRIRVSAWGGGGGGERGTAVAGGAGDGGAAYASTTLVVTPGMRFGYEVAKPGWGGTRVSPPAAGSDSRFWLEGTSRDYAVLHAGGGGAASREAGGAGGVGTVRNLPMITQSVTFRGGDGAPAAGVAGGGGGGSAGHGGPGGDAVGQDGGYGGDNGPFTFWGAAGGDGGSDEQAGQLGGEPGGGGGGSGRVLQHFQLGQGPDHGAWGGDGRIRIALCP